MTGWQQVLRSGHLLGVLLLFLFSSSVMIVARQQGGDGSLEDLAARAEEAQQRGDYRAAAAAYRELLKRRPSLVEARANLGLMLYLLGEYNQAALSFEQVLRGKPHLFAPNLFQGLALLRLQQPRRALPYLHRAQAREPRDEKATLGLAQAYLALHEYAEANEWYFRATQANQARAEAWYGLGVTYLSLERSAAQHLAKAWPNSVYSRILLAESLLQQARAADAVALYRRLLPTQPLPPCFRAALGFALVRQRELSAAEQEFQQELKDSPGCLLARLGAARLSAGRKEIEGALKELENAWRIDRNFVQTSIAYFLIDLGSEQAEELKSSLQRLLSRRQGPADTTLLSFLLSALERWRRAPTDTVSWSVEFPTGGPSSGNVFGAVEGSGPEQLFEQGRYTQCAEGLKPGTSALSAAEWLLLARCSYYSGDYRTSFMASGESLKLGSHHPESGYWRAKAAGILAVNALGHAALTDPNSPRIHLLLGDAYREKQHYREAEVEYRKAIDSQPQNLAGYLGLATTYYQASQLEQATAELEKALQLSPRDPEANYLLGDILVSQRRHEEAWPHLNLALNSRPENVPHVHALLAKVHTSRGRIDKAIAELKQSLEGDRDGSYHYRLYQLYRQLGDEKAARAALQKSEEFRRRSHERAAKALSPFSSPP